MRNITVNNTLYKWKFSSHWDSAYYSTICILSEDKNTKVIINFKTKDTFTAGSPLNEGMPMLKNEREYLVNLNRPVYIAECISFLLNRGIDFAKRTTTEISGNKLLLDMGYQDIGDYLMP